MPRKRNTPQEIGGAARREALGLTRIQIDLTREEKRALHHKAIDADVSMSEVVRDLIRAHCGLNGKT
jgi:hypothetical protein